MTAASPNPAVEGHWPLHARQWALVGPPLRPSEADVAVVRGVAREWQSAHAGDPLRVLVLGVTPELCLLDWPEGARLVAVDRSLAMIAALFPRAGLVPGATAVRAEWQALPMSRGAFDLVVGDGVYNNLEFPGAYRTVSSEVRRVLSPGGRFVVRTFVRPEAPEPLDAVKDALWSGRIGTFHALKWRLAMAVHGETEVGVKVADILLAFESVCPDRRRLGAELGWSSETVGTIDAYRGSATVYTFPTLGELALVTEADFLERSRHLPAYELGPLCPTLVLEPR